MKNEFLTCAMIYALCLAPVIWAYFRLTREPGFLWTGSPWSCYLAALALTCAAVAGIVLPALAYDAGTSSFLPAPLYGLAVAVIAFFWFRSVPMLIRACVVDGLTGDAFVFFWPLGFLEGFLQEADWREMKSWSSANYLSFFGQERLLDEAERYAIFLQPGSEGWKLFATLTDEPFVPSGKTMLVGILCLNNRDGLHRCLAMLERLLSPRLPSFEELPGTAFTEDLNATQDALLATQKQIDEEERAWHNRCRKWPV